MKGKRIGISKIVHYRVFNCVYCRVLARVLARVRDSVSLNVSGRIKKVVK